VSNQPAGDAEKLTSDHHFEEFSSGAHELDEWLRKRALKGQEVGNASVFVVAKERHVLGYYALASAGVEQKNVPGSVRRNAPEPIPVLLLARLAVSEHAQGRGIGRLLLRDAMLRAIRVSEDIGFRALLIHCRDDAAREFYRSVVPQFLDSPTEPLHLVLPLSALAAAAEIGNQ
jgi:GNAT superfamily N-acetyltransferase